MGWLDLALLALAGLFAIVGWRQGLIRGALSMVGFLGGALLAVVVLPNVLTAWHTPSLVRGLVSVGGVIAIACAGQAVANWIGRTLRDDWTWRPAEVVDSIGGAAFYLVALAAVVWVVASAAVLLPAASVTAEVRTSQVVAGIDAVAPQQARQLLSGLEGLIDSSGFPRAFDSLIEPAPTPVEPPDAATLLDPQLRAAIASVVRVSGDAPGCDLEVTGSGFVVAPQRVMTNAHVVAGVSDPVVEVGGRGERLPATVVYFDPLVDVAVLSVPDLDVPALTFADSARTGTDAAVAGFPGGGDLAVEAARVRGRIEARGEDIYGERRVSRDIYSVRSQVLPGDSGGPLLSTEGRVIGVTFAAAVQDSSTGYALSAQEVEPAVDAGRRATAAVDTGACVAK